MITSFTCHVAKPEIRIGSTRAENRFCRGISVFMIKLILNSVFLRSLMEDRELVCIVSIVKSNLHCCGNSVGHRSEIGTTECLKHDLLVVIQINEDNCVRNDVLVLIIPRVIHWMLAFSCKNKSILN